MSITPNSRLTITIAGAILAVASLVGATWRAANAVNDLKTEVSDLRRDIRTIASERWTTGDMERWAFRLERENRSRALVVPDVRGVRPESSQ